MINTFRISSTISMISTISTTSTNSTISPTSTTSTVSPTSTTSTISPTRTTSTISPTSATSTISLTAQHAASLSSRHNLNVVLTQCRGWHAALGGAVQAILGGWCSALFICAVLASGTGSSALETAKEVLHSPLKGKLPDPFKEISDKFSWDSLFSPDEAVEMTPEMKEKLQKKKLLLKTSIAKYLAKKFTMMLQVLATVQWNEILKQNAVKLAASSYGLFPDQTAAAIQWAFHTPDRDSYYQVYGNSQLQDSTACPKNVNETMACAMKIVTTKVSGVLSYFSRK
ncbi:hypothetical protein FHG87_008561 [Trinorchestia longiramus]|nr:hypothetical protein FHG87_008561 [Trinorchestia longiramus]